MTKRRTLVLDDAQRSALEKMARHAQVHMRRRGRALLLIADGYAPYWVARHGLDKPIAANQVYMWLNRYQAEGIGGLVIRPGRGRKPAYFPAFLASGVRASVQSGAAHA